MHNVKDSGSLIEDEDELARIVCDLGTVAVVGMQDESKASLPAFLIPQRVKAAGIRVIPVNPKVASSLGEKSYPSLASVPEPFDAVNVFRRSEVVEALADEILRLPKLRRPRVVWMQTGVRNMAAALKLTDAGIQVVMDACLGVYVAKYR
jgi:predicted CoA-binding protein